MGAVKREQDVTVRLPTVYLVALIAMGVGFLSGVLVTVYRSNPPAAQNAATAGRERMLAALEQDIADNPGNTAAWIQLGHIYFDTDRYPEAIAAYEKALQLDPNNADVHTDLGVMLRRNGEPRKAVAAFERAAALDPAHEASRYNKGIVLMHDLKDTAGAVAAWRDLLAVNPLATAPNGESVDALVEQALKRSTGE